MIKIDGHYHIDEIDKIELDFNDFDVEKLNALEQLGLYLLGQISRGKLCELWESGFLTCQEILNHVLYIGVDKVIKKS